MHPYESLPDKSFWATAVARRNMFDIGELWDPRFAFDPRMKVATFGSCFAQHIGKALEARGFNWFIAEDAPPGLSAENARKYNYGAFSARTGNIYTVSLLRQWVEWATGAQPVPDEIWVQDGRFYDPFRPNIEPLGFESEAELLRSRELAIEAFKATLVESERFVFTLGLTESWWNAAHGYEYPMCPGTVAGTFDAQQHRFFNQDYAFIHATLKQTLKAIQALNPDIRFLLTVSPVPLTATVSGNHVMVATMESKSVLRAVAGALRRECPNVDYFPSYEIINATPFRGTFFEPNQRSVNHAGVDHVMKTFFCGLEARREAEAGTASAPFVQRDHAGTTSGTRHPRAPGPASSDEVVCEEALLGAFSQGVPAGGTAGEARAVA